MTKLSPEGERAIRQLDEADDDTEREFMLYYAPDLPDLRVSPAVGTFLQIHRQGRLEYYAPPKPKRGERRRPDFNELDLILEDFRRLHSLRLHAESHLRIAAERHLRFVTGYCTLDEEGETELDELVERLRRRRRGSGTTGGARYRARRAK